MARTTVAVGCYYNTAMFLLFSVFALWVLPVHAFIPVSPLMDCPRIPPQDGIKIEQVTGTWRLAYLFMDDNADLEEDTTCAVAEIMQVNETQLELLLYVDGRKDEFTIDRYTKEFDVTIQSPGKWVLHSSFLHLEFIQVTVIGLSSNHLVLTFCVEPFEGTSQTSKPDDYDSLLNQVDSVDDIFKAQKYTKLFKDLNDLNLTLEKHQKVRRPSRRFRGRRDTEDSDESPGKEEKYQRLLKYLKSSQREDKPKKHLWTIILVKHNNNSALKFVENASLLMKYGFKLTKGQLVSFGSCSLSKK